MNIKDVLENLGYKLRDDGDFWRSNSVYRGGDNSTSLRISKKTGRFIDFSANVTGSFEELIKLSTGSKSIDEVKAYLLSNNVLINKIFKEEPKISMNETWEPVILNRLIKDNYYWNNRGITDKTLKDFKGGVAISGRMEGRYVFPIFNKENKIIGLSGRDISNQRAVKWKHIGEKKNWVFPLINRKEIEDFGCIILVEGIGDVLKLWQCGYRNVIALFGVHLSDKLLASLSTLKLDKIIISTNNDVGNNNVGNNRAVEIYYKLAKFCNPEKLQIKLPTKKDFLEMSDEEISIWRKKKIYGIVGSRTFEDEDKFKSLIGKYTDKIATIVSGAAKGTDTMARNFALYNNIPMVEFIPDWKKYGRKAGMLRNSDIVNVSENILAFLKDNSPGTSNSIARAKQVGKPIEIFNC